MRDALGKPKVISVFTEQGLDVTPSSPEELAAQMQAEQEKWAEVLSRAVLK